MTKHFWNELQRYAFPFEIEFLPERRHRDDYIQWQAETEALIEEDRRGCLRQRSGGGVYADDFESPVPTPSTATTNSPSNVSTTTT